MTEELFDIYDEAGNRIGTTPRRKCHGDPTLLHHTAHVVVFHPETGAILLQKRSFMKDIQPGKWDTAVGGHLALGEDYEAGNRVGVAPRRECHGNPKLLHRTVHVVVFHPETGAILLQKRAVTKDIQPGKWDTAVGGHLALGEDYETGARR